MRNCLSGLCLVISCVLALPAFAVDAAGKGFVLWAGSSSAGGCVTTQCHAILGRAKHVHPPVAEGDCLACHSRTDQPHPGAGSMTLVEEEPDLCLQCHENPAAGMAYPHSALDEGCTGCHSPHQGALPKYVMQSGGRLCLICHEEVMKGEYVHGPVRAINCQICHGIHGGENEAMLNLPGKDNCLACHAGIKEIMDAAVSRHDPVANGVCWDCHTPHASNFKPFLKAFYSQELYAPYKGRNFALCFNCHSGDAFVFERTSEATGFRNRDQNLHFFHVNRPEKGRVCKNCHGVHGADQGKLLMSKVPGFGGWEIPLTWVSDGERATCYVGCHRPKTYDRLRKVKNP